MHKKTLASYIFKLNFTKTSTRQKTQYCLHIIKNQREINKPDSIKPPKLNAIYRAYFCIFTLQNFVFNKPRIA
jgi:hypothetical protein